MIRYLFPSAFRPSGVCPIGSADYVPPRSTGCRSLDIGRVGHSGEVEDCGESEYLGFGAIARCSDEFSELCIGDRGDINRKGIYFYKMRRCLAVSFITFVEVISHEESTCRNMRFGVCLQALAAPGDALVAYERRFNRAS